MCCLGNILASLRTRLSSVPTAHEVPSLAAAIVSMILSVEPTASAACTTSYWHSGWTITCTPGIVARAASIASRENRPCTEQCPRHRMTRAVRTCSRVSPPAGLCGSNTTQSCSEKPSSPTAVLRPRCWSGRNSTLPAPSAPPRWSKAHCKAVPALPEVQIVPPWRPVNALMAAEEFMYVTGTLDASLGGEVAALAQDQQRQRGVAKRFQCGTHALIVCCRGLFGIYPWVTTGPEG